MEDINNIKKSIPKFKYHPDPIKTGSIKLEKIVCTVCGKESNCTYGGPFYSRTDIGKVCPNCIADGSAAKKYDCEFTTISEVDDNDESEDEDKLISDDKIDELFHRTPGFYGIQETGWLRHCGDFCEFLGGVSWDNIVELGIEKEIESDYLDTYKDGVDFEEVKQSLKIGGYIGGFLFHCPKCGKYRLLLDVE